MDEMCYVAADPNQPGAAWAIVSESLPNETPEQKAKWKKEVAKSIAGYIRDGATVQHVTREVGIEMLTKWIKPTKSQKALIASADLFEVHGTRAAAGK